MYSRVLFYVVLVTRIFVYIYTSGLNFKSFGNRARGEHKSKYETT